MEPINELVAMSLIHSHEIVGSLFPIHKKSHPQLVLESLLLLIAAKISEAIEISVGPLVHNKKLHF